MSLCKQCLHWLLACLAAIIIIAATIVHTRTATWLVGGIIVWCLLLVKRMQNVVCTYLMSLAVLINTKLTQKHDRLSQTLFQLCLYPRPIRFNDINIDDDDIWWSALDGAFFANAFTYAVSSSDDHQTRIISNQTLSQLPIFHCISDSERVFIEMFIHSMIHTYIQLQQAFRCMLKVYMEWFFVG